MRARGASRFGCGGRGFGCGVIRYIGIVICSSFVIIAVIFIDLYAIMGY